MTNSRPTKSQSFPGGPLPPGVHDFGGQGPALVLVHAVGFCGRVLGPVAAPLVERFRCIGLDLRGHGERLPPIDGDVSWSAQAADIVEFVDALGLGQPWAFGHSAGGSIIMDAEAQRPGTFAGIAAFEPPLWPGPAPRGLAEDLAKGALRRRSVFASSADAYTHFASRPPMSALAPTVLAAYVANGLTEQPDGSVVLRCPAATEAASYLAGAVHDGFARLAQIRCPVRLLMGETSRPEVAVGIATIADTLTATTSAVVRGVGHFGPLEQPASVAAAITALLLSP